MKASSGNRVGARMRRLQISRPGKCAVELWFFCEAEMKDVLTVEPIELVKTSKCR